MLKWATYAADWSLLWPLAGLAMVLCLRRGGDRQRRLLALAIVLPLPAYAASYVLSQWQPFTLHLDSSFPRLLLQLALPAVVLVARTAAGGTKPGAAPDAMPDEATRARFRRESLDAA